MERRLEDRTTEARLLAGTVPDESIRVQVPAAIDATLPAGHIPGTATPAPGAILRAYASVGVAAHCYLRQLAIQTGSDAPALGPAIADAAEACGQPLDPTAAGVAADGIDAARRGDWAIAGADTVAHSVRMRGHVIAWRQSPAGRDHTYGDLVTAGGILVGVAKLATTRYYHPVHSHLVILQALRGLTADRGAGLVDGLYIDLLEAISRAVLDPVAGIEGLADLLVAAE